jgi:hypothetical protein
VRWFTCDDVIFGARGEVELLAEDRVDHRGHAPAQRRVACSPPRRTLRRAAATADWRKYELHRVAVDPVVRTHDTDSCLGAGLPRREEVLVEVCLRHIGVEAQAWRHLVD